MFSRVKNVAWPFENYDDIRPKDVIEIFERESVERKLT